MIITIIYNTMIAHPTTQALVHNITKDNKDTSSPLDLNAKSLDNDPFIFDEMDMKLCKADQSSLWEIYVSISTTTTTILTF